jgi:hypothetical protein
MLNATRDLSENQTIHSQPFKEVEEAFVCGLVSGKVFADLSGHDPGLTETGQPADRVPKCSEGASIGYSAISWEPRAEKFQSFFFQIF